MKPRKKNDPEKNKNKKTITLFVSDTRQGIRAITNKKNPASIFTNNPDCVISVTCGSSGGFQESILNHLVNKM
jgi:hypothetical protein